MKKIYAFVLMLFLFASSCKDPCAEINCNFGTCADGTCFCDDGYEGINCDQQERAKFLGTWSGPMTCSLLGDAEATFIVTEDPSNETGVLYELVFDLLDLEPLEGTVAGDKFFITASMQSLDFMGFPVTLTVDGEGDFNADGTVTLNLDFTSAFASGVCTAELSPE